MDPKEAEEMQKIMARHIRTVQRTRLVRDMLAVVMLAILLTWILVLVT